MVHPYTQAEVIRHLLAEGGSDLQLVDGQLVLITAKALTTEEAKHAMNNIEECRNASARH